MGASAEDLSLFGDEDPKKTKGTKPAGASAEDLAMFAAPTSVDMGPEARRAKALRGGMRPAVAPDDVTDIQPDLGKRDIRRTLQGRQDLITTPGAGQQRDERAMATDPIKNDPLAGMIVQGIPATGAGMVASGLTRMVAPGLARMAGGAVTGAASNPDDPLTGAAIGAIPGIPGAVGAADSAIGEAALNRMTNPASKSLEAAGKKAGAAGGAILGHKAAGFVGAGVGAGIGAQLGGKAGLVADKATEALANRYMRQQVQEKAAAILDKLKAGPGAPSGHKVVPPGDVSRIFPGAVDEAVPQHVGEELTVPEKYVPIQKTADAKVAELDSSHPFGPETRAETPSMRAQVIKDARTFRDAPPEPAEPAPVGEDLGAKLSESLKVLGKLKEAKAAERAAILLEGRRPPPEPSPIARPAEAKPAAWSPSSVDPTFAKQLRMTVDDYRAMMARRMAKSNETNLGRPSLQGEYLPPASSVAPKKGPVSQYAEEMRLRARARGMGVEETPTNDDRWLPPKKSPDLIKRELDELEKHIREIDDYASTMAATREGIIEKGTRLGIPDRTIQAILKTSGL